MPQDNQADTTADAACADAVASDAKTPSTFEFIEGGFSLLQSTDVKQKLLQWNLDGSLQVDRFRVRRKLVQEQDVDLVREFFGDQAIRARLQLPIQGDRKAAVRVEPLRVTVTSLAFFDKLEEARLVSESGALRRCLDDVFDGSTASDLLKESFINPDSDHGDVFTEDEQREFIFHLFRALVIGGSMCQPDEWLAPYTDMTKRFYKALVAVKKNAADRNVIDLTSRVYRIEGDGIFDSDSRFCSCFVVLDATKRWLTVWHNTFRPYW